MIELKNIHKIYRMGGSEVRALDGVSLKINSGEFVAIIGPSGSGKSTLMHVLGLLDRQDSGSYTFFDKDITGLSDKERAVFRNGFIGFIFQQFHLLPRMSALENTELPLVYAGKQHLSELAKEKIELVGLADRMTHHPNEMSGGQQQRVAIARALVNDPLMILADEPTGNLDSKSKDEILSILKRLNGEGRTVVIVTHEKEIALSARRIISMRDGKIISDEVSGSREEVLARGPADKRMKELFENARTGAGKTKFLDYFKQAGFAMVSHKLRSALSILGILIGVAAVIAMLALGEGAKLSIEKQLVSLGSNLLIVRPGSTRLHGVALEAGSVTRFTFQDVDEIKELDGVCRVSASVSGRAQLVNGNKNWNSQVDGADQGYLEMRALMPVLGRPFSKQDVALREKVALLGTTVVEQLFGQANPVGENIKVNLVNFRVIGILPPKGAAGFRDQDDVVIVPVTTAMYRLLGKTYVDTIYVEAKDSVSIESLQGRIEKLIIRQHRLSKDSEDSFQVRNMSDIRQTLLSTTKTISLLLGCIAAISLFVGGIGIMNIMLVSVTERTREIGLRKAIGADDRDIMTQFLIEAVMMSFLGGLSGIALGAGASVLITLFAGWAVKISSFSVILATVFSLVLGIVFGLWPAKQASKLDPIEALRYE